MFVIAKTNFSKDLSKAKLLLFLLLWIIKDFSQNYFQCNIGLTEITLLKLFNALKDLPFYSVLIFYLFLLWRLSNKYILGETRYINFVSYVLRTSQKYIHMNENFVEIYGVSVYLRTVRD